MNNIGKEQNQYFSGERKSKIFFLIVVLSIFNPVQDNQQMLKGVVSVLLYSLNYPDKFRHPKAIFRDLHVPQQLAKPNEP
jgi:hypothetical protein